MEREEIKNNLRFFNALHTVSQNIPPIWLMRQAGRYHSHYRKLRKKWSFIELCKNPELSAQVAMGPINEFDFDVAILFSDILFPLEAFGFGLEYSPKPKLSWQLNKKNFKNLKPLEVSIKKMEFQKKALLATRDLLPKDKSLIGFVGGIWTLYTYAVEGSIQSALNKNSLDSQLFKNFSDLMYNFLSKNIKLQLDNGAEIVMVIDTAAGIVSPLFFKTELSNFLNKLARQYPNKLGYYAKGLGKLQIQSLDKNLWRGVGVDHNWNLPNMLLDNCSNFFIQGNFNQNLLLCDKDDLKKHLKKFLDPIKSLDVKKRSGWVCGLGHGVLPKTPEENIKYFVDTVREIFQ